jgi:hypothetical protein
MLCVPKQPCTPKGLDPIQCICQLFLKVLAAKIIFYVSLASTHYENTSSSQGTRFYGWCWSLDQSREEILLSSIHLGQRLCSVSTSPSLPAAAFLHPSLTSSSERKVPGYSSQRSNETSVFQTSKFFVLVWNQSGNCCNIGKL